MKRLLRRIKNAILDVVRPIYLDITTNDINAAMKHRGEPAVVYDTAYCPGNIAARRQWPNDHPYVGRRRVTFAHPVGVTQLDGGEGLAEFTRHWDNLSTVKPTRIWLHRVTNLTFIAPTPAQGETYE